MKKHLLWPIVAYLVFVMASASSAETVINIVYHNQENPPRILGNGSFVDPDTPGITIELLRMVGERIGVTFQFTRMPWKRCLYMVEHGLADATFHASYKPDRAKYGVFPSGENGLDQTRALYRTNYAFYALKGSAVRWDGKTLTNTSQPIGAQLSFAVADDLRKMGYEVEEAPTVEGNLKKLVAGRISVYADLEGIVDNSLQKSGATYEKVEKLHPPLKTKAYYLLVSKVFSGKNRDLTERIWNAVRDIQHSAAYREMLNKYKS